MYLTGQHFSTVPRYHLLPLSPAGVLDSLESLRAFSEWDCQPLQRPRLLSRPEPSRRRGHPSRPPRCLPRSLLTVFTAGHPQEPPASPETPRSSAGRGIRKSPLLPGAGEGLHAAPPPGQWQDSSFIIPSAYRQSSRCRC